MVKKSKEKEKGKGKAKAVTHQVLDVESVMRKCYPIYDAIDAKNYKLASKLAKAAAAKCPGSNIIKALYGVTLERLGRLDEALEVGREVCKMGDMDDHVVNTLTIIFKAANKLEELTSALEEAAASVSGSSSVTAHLSLFNNCARTFQFLKMQQVAMKLYKKTNNLKYVLFAVTSIYLQSVESGKTQFLFLAENMCKKAAASGSRGLMALSEDCGPDALLLYIEVLFSQNKHSEALTLLRSMHGKGTRLLTSQLSMLEVVLCIACKERDAALDILEKHIQCNQEDWHAAKVFMDLSVGTTTPLALPFTQNNVFRQTNMDHVISINPLDKADRFLHQLDLNDHEKESTGFRESGIQRTKALLAKLQETAKDRRKVRAVHLMKLDLLSRQIRLAASEEGTVSARDAMQAELVDSLYDFWSIAGTNISFSSDISDFLTLLSVNSARLFYEKLLGERSKVFEDVTTSAEKGDVSYQTKKKFCQVLSSLEIEVQLIPTLEALSCAQSLSFALDLFVKCKELFKGFDERENTIADPLIVLISKLIWMQQNTNTDKDQDRTTKDTLNVLVNMIIVHQSGVKLSPYNSSMLLSLCLLYGYLGATDLAAEYFWKLDIKYIQLESIGAHMLLPYLSASGNEREALKFCDKLLHFHEDHNRNAGDTFALTFKHGTYLEAVDFAGLRNRLGTSLVRCSVYVERALLKVLQRSPVGLKGIEQIVVNECREVEQALQIEGEDSLLDHFCNQDLSVRPEWAPPFASSALGSLDFWDKKEKELSSSSGNGSGPGSESICWWQTVNAVNRMDEGHKANTLRMNLRRDVVYRYAFLRALGVLLRPEKSDLEACTNMKGFVQLMAKALLGSKEEVTPEEIRRRALEKVEKTSSKLELVALQLFVCSDYLLRFDNEPSEAAAEGFEGSLKEFSKSLAEVEEEMFGDASASTNANGLLCGGKTVTFASAFVRELVSWTTLSLQKWKVLMKQQKVKDASLKALVSRVKSSLEEGITCFRHLLERLDKKLDSHIQLFQESGGEAWEGSPFLQLGCNMPLVSANLAESQLASLKVTCDRLNKYFNLVKALQ